MQNGNQFEKILLQHFQSIFQKAMDLGELSVALRACEAMARLQANAEKLSPSSPLQRAAHEWSPEEIQQLIHIFSSAEHPRPNAPRPEDSHEEDEADASIPFP